MLSIDDVPPLRNDPTDTSGDQDRVEYLRELYHSQDFALQQRDKQIEENARMLAGQQWHVYSDLLNKWVSVAEFLTDDERRWRQRPVINRLLFWYMLTHARMTENPPVVTFQPSTGDQMDAQLAEVMDPIFKTLWRETDMLEKIDQWMTWVASSGTGYLKSRVDLNRGPLRKWLGPTTVKFEPADGSEPVDVFVPIAPFDREGNAQVEVFPEGEQSKERFGFRFTGEPFEEREGQIAVDVISPLEVRGTWGPQPWHEKRWHIQRSLFTPEEVWDKYEVEVEPDVSASDVEGTGELERLLYGSGWYGGAEARHGSFGNHGKTEGLVSVYELWHRPSQVVEGMKETEDSPGGRLMIVTPNTVIRDGPRPVRLPNTSPIHELQFVPLPGRPSGTSPQEMLNPIQRAYNRGVAQIMEHRNLVTNPVVVLDDTSGLNEEEYTNKPGLIVKVRKRPGVTPIEYANPPELSGDVWRTQGMLQDDMSFLGNLEGARGEPPTRDASGELVKELRFNSDRFIGPTMRRASLVLGRMIEDWIALLPTIWDREKVIAYAGEDNVQRTLTVFPELLQEGTVDVQPDIESMLPEGRGERQARVYRMWQDGAFGDPVEPEARRQFLELMRFPHMDRAVKPGGVDRRTAKRENGKILKGVPAEDIAVLEWYDHDVHLDVHFEFMSSPEYLQQPQSVQFAFEQHVRVHEAILQQEALQQLQAQTLLGQQGAAPAGNGGGGTPPELGNPGGETGPGGGDVEGVPSIVPRGPNTGGQQTPQSLQTSDLSRI